jgi:hypothetical protein
MERHRRLKSDFHMSSYAASLDGAATLYVKFTANVVTEFLLLSFQGKDDD